MLIDSLGLGAFLYRNYIIDAVLGLRSIPQKLVTHLICKGSLRTQLPFISMTMGKCIQSSNLELIADMLIGPLLFLPVKQQKWGHPISRSLMVCRLELGPPAWCGLPDTDTWSLVSQLQGRLRTRMWMREGGVRGHSENWDEFDFIPMPHFISSSQCIHTCIHGLNICILPHCFCPLY